jgi:hypothetical protein
VLGIPVGDKEKETSEKAPKTSVQGSQGHLERSSDLGSPAQGDVAGPWGERAGRIGQSGQGLRAMGKVEDEEWNPNRLGGRE